VYREAARRLDIILVEKAIATQEEAQRAIASVQKGEVDGILAPRCCAWNIPGFILEATKQQAIPSMFYAGFWAEHGALASYGPDYYESGRQAARLVDKIFRGADPSEIPVEVNPKIEFAINLKTVKALGLTISPEVLFRADRIVR
jgi:putative ABC transport system substrate-binding protein